MEVNFQNLSNQYDVNNEETFSEHENEYISFSQSQKIRKFKNEKEKVYKFEVGEKNSKLNRIKNAPQNIDIHGEDKIDKKKKRKRGNSSYNCGDWTILIK